jgi:hypothetical protein
VRRRPWALAGQVVMPARDRCLPGLGGAGVLGLGHGAVRQRGFEAGRQWRHGSGCRQQEARPGGGGAVWPEGSDAIASTKGRRARWCVELRWPGEQRRREGELGLEGAKGVGVEGGRVHGGWRPCMPARGSNRGRKTPWETPARARGSRDALPVVVKGSVVRFPLHLLNQGRGKRWLVACGMGPGSDGGAYRGRRRGSRWLTTCAVGGRQLWEGRVKT